MARKKEVTKDSGNGKAAAILAYVLVGIIWYFVDDNLKKNAFAKFHVKQALNLLIIGIIVNVFTVVPIVGWVLGPILSLILFVLWIIGLVNAIGGKTKQVPIVGEFAEKYLTF